MKCLCGSGKFMQNCHDDAYTKEKMRSFIKYEILQYDPSGQVSINAQFKSLGFGKQAINCTLKFMKPTTPAGEIIYPILLIKADRAIRPITIDGLHFVEDNGNVIQSIHCMLTPICKAIIQFNTKDMSYSKNGYFDCECKIECEGNPFQSIFAIETKVGLIKLFHHTTAGNARLIHDSLELRSSKWNLQGTHELSVHHYIYLTSLDEINDIFDLLEIGMADMGTTTKLSTDDGKVVEEFEVYRESANNRDATLNVWVDPDNISPQPLILHEPNSFSGSDFSWWEVFHSSIFRVNIKPVSSLPLTHIAENEYTLEVNDNLNKVQGFIAGHGMDMISMKRVLSEVLAHDLPRPGAVTPADIGGLDPQWEATWRKNLSGLAANIFSHAFNQQII